MLIGNWMAAPQGVPNCPPGLEYLSLLDQLLIEQKIDLADVLFEFKSNYEFYIRNAMGQHVNASSFLKMLAHSSRKFHEISEFRFTMRLKIMIAVLEIA